MYPYIRRYLNPTPNTHEEDIILFRPFPKHTANEWREYFGEPRLVPTDLRFTPQQMDTPVSCWDWILMFDDMLDEPDALLLKRAEMKIPYVEPLPPNPRKLTNELLKQHYKVIIPDSVKPVDLKIFVTSQLQSKLQNKSKEEYLTALQLAGKWIDDEMNAYPEFLSKVKLFRIFKKEQLKKLEEKNKYVKQIQDKADLGLMIVHAAQRWYDEGRVVQQAHKKRRVEQGYGENWSY